MNKNEILKIEEEFRDTLENKYAELKTATKDIKISDIKLVGEASTKDKINGKDISQNVFIVDIEIIEVDENGRERVTKQKNYYFGNDCIGGTLGDNQLVYNQNILNSEPDKIKAINELLAKTSEQKIENNSMNKLQTEELAEVLTAYYGEKISENEAQDVLEKMNKFEVEELKEEKEEKKGKDEEDLSKKQADNIKVNGIQETNLNKKVDGQESLGKRLDLEGYDKLYVIYSDKVDEIADGTKKNTTTYSLVGITNDGRARVLNDEFEVDKSSGNKENKNQTKIRADGTATIDSKDISVYTRKSNGARVGCENEQGTVNMFLYDKIKGTDDMVGIQISTSQTREIPIESREIMNRNKGTEHKDAVKNEIQEHTENGCKPKDVRDFDGDKATSSHEHINIEYYVQDILNYEDDGKERIKDVFTEGEVRDKLIREIQGNHENTTIEQIVENIKQEMNQDAMIYDREEHKLQ